MLLCFNLILCCFLVWIKLCLVTGQYVGGAPRPPPMPINQLPRDPEMQADMMENRPWAPGPYGYHHQPFYNNYPPQGPPQYPPSYGQPPYRQQNNGRTQIIPLHVNPQYPQGVPQAPHNFGPRPGLPQNSNVNTNNGPKSISARKPKPRPPPQNLHTGTIVGKRKSLAPTPSIRINRQPLINKPQPGSKFNSNTHIMRRPQNNPIQWKPPPSKWNYMPPPQPPKYPMPPPPGPQPPHPPRPNPIPPGPPLGPPPAPIVGGGAPGNANPPGSQDGPCIPSPTKPVHRGHPGFPSVRHQPRVPYPQRYRRAVYNLSGCTCTDIQDIDPLGGDNYLTKAGYCHVFQYYCGCPSTVRTGPGAPPPG